MANILFKRGSHAQLPAKAVDGAFYLTTDSHRLYAGIGEDLVDLNKYIRTAATLAELNTWTDLQLGDFAYIQGGNILAVYQEVEGTKKWVQINQNTDTTNKTAAFSGTGATDAAELKITITDSVGGKVEDSIKFIGTQGVDTSIDADGNITIKGCTYSVGAALANSVFTITLNASDDEVTDSTVAFAAGKNVEFTSTTANTLSISVPDMGLAATGHSFTANNAGGASVAIKDKIGGTATATLADGSLFYKVGAGETKTTVNNQGNLPVYTISEIDDMMKDLNPMKYLGTVNTITALTGKSNVKAGDTYMASAPFSLKTVTGDDKNCKIGDLFIATGTENANGVLTNVTWTYVPAGDDSQTDTTYKGVVTTSDHKMNVQDMNGNDVAGIDIDVDGKITATSSTYALKNGGVGMKTSIGHAAPGANDATKKQTGAAQEEVYNFSAITGVTVDSTGHVASYTTTAISVPKTQLQAATAAASGNVATVTNSLKDEAGSELGTAAFKIDASADDNLNVTATGNTVTVKLEWGSF